MVKNQNIYLSKLMNAEYSVELTQAADGEQMTRESFERALDAILRLDSEIWQEARAQLVEGVQQTEPGDPPAEPAYAASPMWVRAGDILFAVIEVLLAWAPLALLLIPCKLGMFDLGHGNIYLFGFVVCFLAMWTPRQTYLALKDCRGREADRKTLAKERYKKAREAYEQRVARHQIYQMALDALDARLEKMATV